MNEIKCSGAGCTEVFRTNEPVSKNATYTCRNHTGKDEISTVAFQRFAHDSKLGASAGKKPSHE